MAIYEKQHHAFTAMAAGGRIVGDVINGVGTAGKAGGNGFPRRETDLREPAYGQLGPAVVVVELVIIMVGIGKQQLVSGDSDRGAIADYPFNVETSATVGGATKKDPIVGANIRIVKF